VGELLTLRELHVRFGGVAALTDVALDVGRGEILGLIGPNGAGKTTLLNTLSRFVRPVRGRVSFQGTDLLLRRAHEIAGLGITRTFQNLALFASMTVLENVLVGRHPRRRTGVLGDMGRSRRARESERGLLDAAGEALRLLDLQHLAGQRVGDLPYGHQKLVEMARALAAGPTLLLLDEPGAGLNSEEKEDLEGRIRRIREATGCAILLVEHDMEMVRHLCERVTVLNFGRRIAEGHPERVLAHPDVVHAYLGSAHAQA
jgi:ABC-type branched-subunit amino acid transport system ATPase component